MKKVIIYYTDNKLDKNIASFCFENLLKVRGIIPIVLVSQKRTSFLYKGEIIVGDKSKSRQSMFEQIQSGLQVAKRMYQPDFVFLAEHDVLYPEWYFNSTTEDEKNFYYATNNYYMTDKSFFHNEGINLSTLRCSFDLLLSHVNWRLYRMQHLNMKKGGLVKCEPGTSLPSDKFKTLSDPTGGYKFLIQRFPCVDIRHGNNLSKVEVGPKPIHHIGYWKDHSQLKEKMKWV